MATQKPGEWVQSLITRFDAQVSIFIPIVRPFILQKPAPQMQSVNFMNEIDIIITTIGLCQRTAHAVRLKTAGWILSAALSSVVIIIPLYIT